MRQKRQKRKILRLREGILICSSIVLLIIIMSLNIGSDKPIASNNKVVAAEQSNKTESTTNIVEDEIIDNDNNTIAEHTDNDESQQQNLTVDVSDENENIHQQEDENVDETTVEQEEIDESEQTQPTNSSIATGLEVGNEINKEQIEHEKKVAYLTIDDGPYGSSKDILDILEEYNAKATFFMVEPKMREYPELVREMVRKGHGVGLHSVTHDKHQFYSSRQSLLNELSVSNETLKEITGETTPLIRTPYGSAPYMTDEYKAAVTNNGYIMWDWNVDSKDWKYRDERYVHDTIAQIEKLSEQDHAPVILLHDKTTTVNHLRELLEYLTENHYELLKLDASLQPVQF
ncbi:polysaccharide deacetylase family protein [Cytobacillus sp. IB215316]|uniref:polysaccharide deacetylase family protein n=1 Tax=Cytobacillus sp. IB215316 TaxID=3097354 RepID=UPI002A0CAD07|nr:polysaccharide deacetylase family protein [Cytobacillus sp. IB215316]MDX8360114.1 polysaccharide deacetylase family protein [Cytobacillus sp. IB215316]